LPLLAAYVSRLCCKRPPYDEATAVRTLLAVAEFSVGDGALNATSLLSCSSPNGDKPDNARSIALRRLGAPTSVSGPHQKHICTKDDPGRRGLGPQTFLFQECRAHAYLFILHEHVVAFFTAAAAPAATAAMHHHEEHCDARSLFAATSYQETARDDDYDYSA